MIGGNNIKKWDTLSHNGPLFPTPYEPHNIPVLYNNEEISLLPESEEIATLYAKLLENTVIENKTFRKNFWNDWKKYLSKDSKIKDLDNCDFSLIYNDYIKKKDILKNLPKEEKERIKNIREKNEEKYKFCIIDGKTEKVGNYKIEPIGIFMGRGTNPKLGRIKPKILPEDVTINLDVNATIPEPSLKGHKWKKVVHDNTAIWLASWKDEITGKQKYIFTSHESEFKSQSDEKKFDRARKLKTIIKKIRLNNNKNIISSDEKVKQLATALYLIDNLALRVGSQKNSKGADTVGVSSLRFEHLKLLDNNYIKLDFLGKDSIRYCNKVKVTDEVYKNLKDFLSDKEKRDHIFNLISSQSLNDYLKSFMEKLTSKVFRTYNASETFQKNLLKIDNDKIEKLSDNERINFLINLINQANAEVAILCNHQKAVSTTFKNQISKIDDKIKESKKKMKTIKAKNSKKQKERIKKLKEKIKIMKMRKKTKNKMKTVSLGTSKDNYIDPRIIVSFMKKYDIPIEKIFTKTSQKRFEWAMDISKDYLF